MLIIPLRVSTLPTSHRNRTQVESLLEQLDQKFEEMSGQILDRSTCLRYYLSSVPDRNPVSQ